MSPPIEGVFQGSRKLDVKGSEDPALLAAVAKVRLEVKRDGRATYLSRGMIREGVVSTSGDEVIFKTESVAGIPIEKQPKEIQADTLIRFQRSGQVLKTPDGIELTPR